MPPVGTPSQMHRGIGHARHRRSRSQRGVCGIPPGATGDLGTIRSPPLANVTGVNRIALDPTEFRAALPPQSDLLIEDPGLKRLEPHQTVAMGLKCAADSVAGRLWPMGANRGRALLRCHAIVSRPLAGSPRLAVDLPECGGEVATNSRTPPARQAGPAAAASP